MTKGEQSHFSSFCWRGPITRVSAASSAPPSSELDQCSGGSSGRLQSVWSGSIRQLDAQVHRWVLLHSYLQSTNSKPGEILFVAPPVGQAPITAWSYTPRFMMTGHIVKSYSNFPAKSRPLKPIGWWLYLLWCWSNQNPNSRRSLWSRQTSDFLSIRCSTRVWTTARGTADLRHCCRF